jgi:hypothetical protein
MRRYLFFASLLAVLAVLIGGASSASAQVVRRTEAGVLPEGTQLGWEAEEFEADFAGVIWAPFVHPEWIEPPANEIYFIFNQLFNATLVDPSGQQATFESWTVGREIEPLLFTINDKGKPAATGALKAITPTLRFVAIFQEDVKCTYKASKMTFKFTIGEPGDPVPFTPKATKQKFTLDTAHSAAAGCPSTLLLSVRFSVHTRETPRPETVLLEF